MKYNYRIVFPLDKKRILKYLKKSKIEFDEDKTINLGILNIYEDDHNFLKINKLLISENIKPIVITEYDISEINNAEWFSVRSIWLNGYTYPYDDYQEIFYGINIEENCLCEKQQIANLCIPKEIKGGTKKYFCSINGISDELIVNSQIIELLNNSELKGFSFRNIMIKNKESMKSKQVMIHKTLDEELDLKHTIINKTIQCEFCKRNKIILLGKEIYYSKSSFENINVDIVKSKSVFGESGKRQIYISKKFYHFLKNNKLDKNLIFQPIFMS